MFPRGGESSERTEEPNQIQAGPQGPRSMADEGVKGVMMVDSPPHQPKKKTVTLGGTENSVVRRHVKVLVVIE